MGLLDTTSILEEKRVGMGKRLNTFSVNDLENRVPHSEPSFENREQFQKVEKSESTKVRSGYEPNSSRQRFFLPPKKSDRKLQATNGQG